MLLDIWARATAKWRGILVYAVLHACNRFVNTYIMTVADTPGIRLYGALACAATSLFCLVQILLLLTTDRPGDEAWPPIWS